jgi:hypothetical protein
VQSGGIAPIERFECLPILRCYTPDQVEVVVFGETRGDLLDRDRAFGDLDASAAPSGCARRGVYPSNPLEGSIARHIAEIERSR